MEIKGKVFIVTGGASGLGEGTARMLAREGASVVVADLQAERGAAVAAEIGGRFVRCDVSQEADGQRVVAEARARASSSASSTAPASGRPRARSASDGAHALGLFAKVVTVNLIGSFNMIRLAAEAMSRERAGADRRARRADLDGERRRLRRADRPGGLFGVEGRHRRHDLADRARPVAQRHPQHDDRAGHLRHADALHHAGRGAAGARRQRAFPEPSRHAGRLRQARPRRSSRTRC